MKIALCSDIHLEFGHLPIENTENADVLLLAGDICTAHGFSDDLTRNSYYEFFKHCSIEFPLDDPRLNKCGEPGGDH